MMLSSDSLFVLFQNVFALFLYNIFVDVVVVDIITWQIGDRIACSKWLTP